MSMYTHPHTFKRGDLVRVPDGDVGVVLFYAMSNVYEHASCEVYVGSKGYTAVFEAHKLTKQNSEQKEAQ